MTTKPSDLPLTLVCEGERLDRATIASGAYLDSFCDLPASLLWSPARIRESMARTMAARPSSGDIWVFAYGSLIWNPLLHYAERRRATLDGWRRSFCLRMIAGRATPQLPGRMLALVPGGATDGVALRIDASLVDDELALMWTREMVTGAYQPVWAPIRLDDGAEAWAIVFTANPAHPYYEQNASASAVAPDIAAAHGALGSNADYVLRLCTALRELDVRDPYVTALEAELQRLGRS